MTLAARDFPPGTSDRAGNGAVELRRRPELDLDPAGGGRTAVPELAGEKTADLLLLNDGGLTYAKIRLDERSTAAVPLLLPHLPHPTP